MYLTGTGATRDIQYLTSDQTWHEKENQPVQSHPKGIMVWVAFDDNRIFSPQFVKPGCKVKADYYIKKVLAPFFHEYNQYYPNKNMIFHHDSAPAHTARKTLKFFEEQKIPFMPPGDWLPNSPDAAPCDFWLWGYLKHKLKQRKVTTIEGLKRAVRDELRNIPDDMRKKALASWPKRVYKIMKAEGKHIENK